jgi:hypothetical protein
VWPVKKMGYAGISPICLLDGSVAFTLSLGTPETVYGLSRQRLQRYERLRKMPNTYNREIVDGRKSCYSYVESNVIVRSLDVEGWNEGINYIVSIRNHALQTASRRRKRDSLDNLSVNCTCPISSFEVSCRPLPEIRKMFGDNRTAEDIPSSYVESPICHHAVVAFHWLQLVYGTYDFGIFGPSEDFVKDSRPLIPFIMKISQEKPRIPDYQLNIELWKEKVPHLRKLNDLVWRS